MKGKEKGNAGKRSKTSPCIFCRIVAGKAEAYRIYEDELSLGWKQTFSRRILAVSVGPTLDSTEEFIWDPGRYLLFRREP